MIVASWRNGATLGATLAALSTQRLPPHEVIVVDSDGGGAAAFVASHLPQALLVDASARLFPGPARNRGLAKATGDVVACLDADCVPDPDWTERIAEGFQEGHQALAGAVLNAPESSVVGWAYFLSEFVPWLPGPAKPVSDAPTCNSSYRAGLIERSGGFTEREILSADSLLHWQMRKHTGASLWFTPAMRVRHRYLGTARELLGRRFEHGRSLALARQLLRPLGRLRRLGWASAALVLLPPFYVLRLFVRAFGHPEVPRRAFCRALPLTTLALLLWAWGQASGFLRPRAGAG